MNLLWLMLGAVGLSVMSTAVAADDCRPAYYGQAGCRAVALWPNAAPYSAAVPCARSGRPLPDPYPQRHAAIYVVELLPGLAYELGFRVPAELSDLQVSLFDRWPFSAGAKRASLPMGPSVRTRREHLSYIWHFSISPSSRSTVMYVLVKTRPPDCRLHHAINHSIWVASRGKGPASLPAAGITHLQGPTNFVLMGDTDNLAYVVEPSAGGPVARADFQPLPIPGDLVRNGRFKQGLNHWIPHRDHEPHPDIDSFSLEDTGLRLYARGPFKEGLMQRIEADVKDAEALVLRADVMVTRQTMGGTGPTGREAPVAIAICYRNADGEECCGERLFWQGFYALAPAEPMQETDGRKVPAGQWYRYIFNLMQLNPKPAFIYYMAVEGAGWSEREGWIGNIHLIKRGGSHE